MLLSVSDVIFEGDWKHTPRKLMWSRKAELEIVFLLRQLLSELMKNTVAGASLLGGNSVGMPFFVAGEDIALFVLIGV